MSLLTKLGRIAITALLYAGLFDVAGVIVSFVLDVTPTRNKSSLLFYAIWFVLGVFCGMLAYNSAGAAVSAAGEGDWSSRPESSATGRLVLCVFSVLIALACLASYLVWWQGGVEDNWFVPDSMPLTLLYFGTMLASAIVAHSVLRPAKN